MRIKKQEINERFEEIWQQNNNEIVKKLNIFLAPAAQLHKTKRFHISLAMP